MRYFIEIAYDGTHYHGWQVQPGSPTVQEQLEKALHFKAGLSGHVTGCGRTDTGVHAGQFFAHFDLDEALNTDQLDLLTYGLNRFLPEDIAVKRVFRVNGDAHSRFDAISRTYQYFINISKNPFNRQFAWRPGIVPDIPLMNHAAALLLSYNDFTSFSKLHTDVKTNNCAITHALWTKKDDSLVFTITADRFLRNMVRAIVGTLLEVGKNKLAPDDFRQIIESRDRQNAGMSVPARGLFLQKVTYNWEQILPTETPV